MSATDVIFTAAQLGVHLSVDGGRLKYEPMPGVDGVPVSLIEKLRQHKDEVIAILSSPLPHGACVDCGRDTDRILTAEGESWLCPDCCDRRWGEPVRLAACG